jgi:glycolate oxidase FAD binding subunit
MSSTETAERIVRPTDLAESARALAESSGRVLIRGAGTAADWAGRPAAPELVLDATGLTGILAHNPADMTVEVRAGIPLRELNAALAEHGQRVAIDAARVARGATLGGLIATADSGPSALTYGSLRDLVIGATLVLADGTVARSGSHVIKNVAGYDLTKLVHGSHGAVALIVEAVLRLHPVPEASATVRLACPLTEAPEAASVIMASPMEPVALEWFADGLAIRLEGTSAALEHRVTRLIEVLDALGRAERLTGEEADALWATHAEQVATPPEGTAMLRVGTRPSRIAGLLTEFGDTLGGRHPVAGLATGIGTVALPADPGTIASAHQAVHRAGGVSTLRSRPAGGRDLPAWGPPPSTVRLMRAVSDELDPSRRLGAGRFAPWLEQAVTS